MSPDKQYENVPYYKRNFHETREEFLHSSFFFFTLAEDIILCDDFFVIKYLRHSKAVDNIIMHTLYSVPSLTNESL